MQLTLLLHLILCAALSRPKSMLSEETTPNSDRKPAQKEPTTHRQGTN